MLARDAVGGGGLFEQLTVAACIPGIFAGVFVIAFRRRSRRRVLYAGFWTLALVYFAGEEASWGQWYFGWKTPEVFLPFNDQGETNLHNISSWLDMKPRILVEVFIGALGFALPLYAAAGGRKWTSDIVILPAYFFPVGAVFMLSRIGDYFPVNIGNSEFREFVIAFFLSAYMIRLAAVAR